MRNGIVYFQDFAANKYCLVKHDDEYALKVFVNGRWQKLIGDITDKSKTLSWNDLCRYLKTEMNFRDYEMSDIKKNMDDFNGSVLDLNINSREYLNNSLDGGSMNEKFAIVETYDGQFEPRVYVGNDVWEDYRDGNPDYYFTAPEVLKMLDEWERISEGTGDNFSTTMIYSNKPDGDLSVEEFRNKFGSIKSSRLLKSSRRPVKSEMDQAKAQEFKEALIRAGYTEDQANEILKQSEEQQPIQGSRRSSNLCTKSSYVKSSYVIRALFEDTVTPKYWNSDRGMWTKGFMSGTQFATKAEAVDYTRRFAKESGIDELDVVNIDELQWKI